ncbi:glyoxalase [Aliidongia dinghuensis]|uniref:Glyoxalase n=1 Tax=Aliidongia dinghuensis TaxID=1867774 RepID=A0A8J2YSF2_9PROT|nr:VOC family protein [Aliidongia dinghuensis]GGF13334.1 glyoxalase [Aliidongia dinghuensis]
MTELKGKFIWYELGTTDTAAAEAFYKKVVGWGAQDSGVKDEAAPDKTYTIWSAGEVPIGGLMALPAEACAAGARPGWIGYIGVKDVDGFAEQVKRAGGAVVFGPADIPTVGRFAIVTDPQGARFTLFKGLSDQEMPTLPPGTPGTTGWHELVTSNWQGAFDFYSGLFGWVKGEGMDMGAMGTYQIFHIGDMPAGGMMTMADRPPSWGFYVNTDAIDAAAARVRDGGGQVVNGPMEVPGGSWIINCIDPQGAAFALVAPKR